MEKKNNLNEIQKNDAIAIVFGFDYLKAVVVGNSGSHIIWYSENWGKSSAIVSTYKQMEAMNWTHIGKWRYPFFLFKKLELL